MCGRFMLAGAVGVSGAAGDEDEYCALEGVKLGQVCMHSWLLFSLILTCMCVCTDDSLCMQRL